MDDQFWNNLGFTINWCGGWCHETEPTIVRCEDFLEVWYSIGTLHQLILEHAAVTELDDAVDATIEAIAIFDDLIPITIDLADPTSPDLSTLNGYLGSLPPYP